MQTSSAESGGQVERQRTAAAARISVTGPAVAGLRLTLESGRFGNSMRGGIDPAAVLAEPTDGPAEQVYDRVGARRHPVKESSAARAGDLAGIRAGRDIEVRRTGGETTGGNSGCPTSCS